MSTGLLYYTGVGSRKCEDPVILALMTSIAQELARQGYILRSGAAKGPDTAFEKGAPKHLRRIYVPNESFGNRPKDEIIVPKKVDLMCWLRACSIAEQYHDLGRHMPQDMRDLMGRNVYQVLGDDLRTPSRFLICDAPGVVLNNEGKVVDVDGGTGLAVRLAVAHNIPIYHLSIPEHRHRMEQFVEKSRNDLHPRNNVGSPKP